MTYFIFIVSFFTLIASYRLFTIAAGTIKLTQFNTVSFVFYYSIVLTTFIGSIYVALGYGSDHWILCYTRPTSRIIAWLCVCYSMIMMPVGMIAVNNLYKIRIKKALDQYIKLPLQMRGLDDSKVLMLGLCVFSMLIFLYIWKYSNSWPLYTVVVDGDMLSAYEERVEVRNNFQGIEYIKNLCGIYLVPAFSYFAYIIWNNKKGVFYFICFVCLFTVSILILTYDTQKAPILFYLIGYLVIRVLVKGYIPKKLFLIIGGVCFFLIGLMYMLFTGKESAFDVLLDPNSALYGRIFVSGYAGVPLSFEWFPDVIKQSTWQIGIPQAILKFLDLPTTESARLMMQRITSEGNLISSYYIAEAWANYGWFGVLLSPIIVGINIQLVHVFLLRHSKEPLTIAFYAMITTKWVVSSGFVNFLYFKILIIQYFLYYVTYYLIYKLKIKL